MGSEQGKPCEFEIDCHEEGIIHFICRRKMTAHMKGERFQVSIRRWNQSPFLSQRTWLFCICRRYLFGRLWEGVIRCELLVRISQSPLG